MGKYQEGFLASAAAHGMHPEGAADTSLGVEDRFGEGCRLAAPLEGRCPCYACADRRGWEEDHASGTRLGDRNQDGVGAPHQRIAFAFAVDS